MQRLRRHEPIVRNSRKTVSKKAMSCCTLFLSVLLTAASLSCGQDGGRQLDGSDHFEPLSGKFYAALSVLCSSKSTSTRFIRAFVFLFVEESTPFNGGSCIAGEGSNCTVRICG